MSARPMETIAPFESADDLIAACVGLHTAVALAFDDYTETGDNGLRPVCCGQQVTTTHFLGASVCARCNVCGARMENVLWPLGPLLYDGGGSCATPSDALIERVGSKQWLVVKWPVRRAQVTP